MYRCSECGKTIGRIVLNVQGDPALYRCPHTGRIADLQFPANLAKRDFSEKRVGRVRHNG